MYIVVSEAGVSVRDADDLKSLSIRATKALEPGALGTLGEPTDDGTHAWLDVAVLRAAAEATLPASAREAWRSGFDGMIGYATSKGWTDERGRVRAHLEPLT
ncbi:MAG: hypothetical protein RLZ14_1422 [Actinomycetota bacterium]